MPKEKKQTTKPQQPSIVETMTDPGKMLKFFSVTPEDFWLDLGQKKAMGVFKTAIDTSKAYQKEMKEKKFKPKEDLKFSEIPLLTRQFLKKYELEDYLGKDLHKAYLFTMSSASSGEATIWPRYLEQDVFLPTSFEAMYRTNWGIDKKSTLFLNAYALGVWIAGSLQSFLLRDIQNRNKISFVNTGAEADKIIEIIKRIGKKYEQIAILTYPTFMRTLLTQAKKAGIKWEDYNIKIFVAGEWSSVEWRDYIIQEMSIKNELTDIMETYGTSEGGSNGLTSPITNLLKRLTYQNKDFAMELFGEETIPSIFQWNPMAIWLEEVNNDIILTTQGAMPLVRYNIKDRGGILKYSKVIEIAEKYGYDLIQILEDRGIPKENIWQMPFVYIFGRSDFTVSIGGANVFPENIEGVIYTEGADLFHSYKLHLDYGKDGNKTEFIVYLQLKKEKKLSEYQIIEIEKKFQVLILQKLLLSNSDFRDAFRVDNLGTNPMVKILSFGEGIFEKDKNKTKPILI